MRRLPILRKREHKRRKKHDLGPCMRVPNDAKLTTRTAGLSNSAIFHGDVHPVGHLCC